MERGYVHIHPPPSPQKLLFALFLLHRTPPALPHSHLGLVGDGIAFRACIHDVHGHPAPTLWQRGQQ